MSASKTFNNSNSEINVCADCGQTGNLYLVFVTCLLFCFCYSIHIFRTNLGIYQSRCFDL